MVFSSSDIASANAQYQGAYMGQMQHAGMIGANLPMADSITGGAINRASAIGSPLMWGGLSLMGLDPISVGISTAMGARGAGMGMMRAGAMGLGAAGAVGAGLMGAQYVGSQMVGGAQQQQAFNASMNGSFRFANNYGGTGFGRGGLGEIGANIRQMSMEQGPNGQMVGFEELGRLASNMGRMGMSQGIRDAKEFSDKFREMVKTVKVIAEQMGTSLEEAQKMMVGLRSAGIFGNANASTATQRIRAGAIAGNIATSEVTGMMQVGSQISRMIGGRGRAGALGGAETITNIGVAQQMGILSEEDIYNVTGLTGAEGRRAMATRQMEQSASFLRGQFGKRFLASVAGRGGKLDESSVEEYMAGGVGTERTMSMAYRNLGKVGRADFVRNEGKLRGAALERFGGLAPMIAMKGWLEDRGVNVNEDADRAMIFMQRNLGMGNDEAEMMLRQVQNLPQMLQQRVQSGQDDSYRTRIQQRQSQVGLEGLKNKFDKAKAEINGALQQAGAEFYTGMSEYVESVVNSLTSTYVKETRRDVSGALRAVLRGGAIGRAAGAETFGLGGSISSKLAGASSSVSSLAANFTEFGRRDADRYADAGFGFVGAGGASNFQANLRQVSDLGNIFNGGTNNQGVVDLGKKFTGQTLQALAQSQGGIQGQGMDRLASFGIYLNSLASKDGAVSELAKRFASGSVNDKARIMRDFTAGADADQSSFFQDPGKQGVYGASRFNTVGQLESAIGQAIVGNAAQASPMSTPTGGMEGRFGFTGTVARAHSPRAPEATLRAMGRYAQSDEGRSLISRMLSNSSEVRDEALKETLKTMGSLKGKTSGDEQARYQVMRGALFAQRLSVEMESGASPERLREVAAEQGQAYGLTADEVLESARGISRTARDQQDTAVQQAAEQFGEEGRRGLSIMTRSGVVTGSGRDMRISSSTVKQLGGKGSAANRVLRAIVTRQAAMGSMSENMTADQNRVFMGNLVGAEESLDNVMRGMSVSEQRKTIQGLSGVAGTSEFRAGASARAGLQERIGKSGVRGFAGALGSNISSTDLKSLKGSGGDKAVIERILDDMGISGAAREKLGSELQKGLTGMASGSKEGVFDASKVIEQVMGSKEAVEARKTKSEADNPILKTNSLLEEIKTASEKTRDYMATLAEQKKTNSEDSWHGGLLGE